MGVSDQSHTSATLPPRKTRYSFYRRLGGPQGRSELMREMSHPPGFDRRTVQPVVILYTDYDISAHIIIIIIIIIRNNKKGKVIPLHGRCGPEGG